MNTIVGWLGMLMVAAAALFVFLAPMDDVLVNFHWTIPLAMTILGLILVVIDELFDRWR